MFAAQRNDYLLQECRANELKRSFSSLDYAFKGYNILQGFPLANSHDPGFTLPIFKADYSSNKQTADCRYSIPTGLVVTPDVSCVTSFSSRLVQTRYEFSKSVEGSAKAEGRVALFKFSASAGYKQSSSTVSTGEHAIIISSASCTYYYSQILPLEPPPFHSSFLKWIYVLNNTSINDTDVFVSFFDTYGTHFPSEIFFGARYTNEYEMTSSSLETMSESGMDVEASASYSGVMFGMGGSASMSTSQRESASEFQQNVTQKTVSVGSAPPADGDAMAWANSVSENPVPVSYDLATIESLFTESYMKNLGVDYASIYAKIQTNSELYCLALLQRGDLDSCNPVTPGIEIDDARLYGFYRITVADSQTCLDTCLRDVHCVAISTCHGCIDHEFYGERCFQFRSQISHYNGMTSSSSVSIFSASRSKDWKTTVIIDKLQSDFSVLYSKINGSHRQPGGEEDMGRVSSTDECRSRCAWDLQCAAFTFVSQTNDTNCFLYSAFNGVHGLLYDKDSTTYFIGRREIPDEIESNPWWAFGLL